MEVDPGSIRPFAAWAPKPGPQAGTASAARELPALSFILRSHALIHAAEGVFYRDALIEAARQSGIKARTITNRAAPEFLESARDLGEALERIGKIAGPPWTMDEKCASLVAFLLLSGPKLRFRLGGLADPLIGLEMPA